MNKTNFFLTLWGLRLHMYGYFFKQNNNNAAPALKNVSVHIKTQKRGKKPMISAVKGMPMQQVST